MVLIRELVRRQIRDAVHHTTTTTFIVYLPLIQALTSGLIGSLGLFNEVDHHVVVGIDSSTEIGDV